jgi:hypothetical protein
MNHQEDDENDPLFAFDKEGNVLVSAQLRMIFLVSTGYYDVLLGFPLSFFATVAVFHLQNDEVFAPSNKIQVFELRFCYKI